MTTLQKITKEVQWRLAGPVEPRTATFLQCFGVMFRNGIGVGATLDILTEQEEHPQLREALKDVTRSVCQSGRRLSEGLNHFPEIFSPEIVLMVRTGENTGELGGQVERAGQMVERSVALKKRVVSALSSPAMTAGASLVMLFFVVKFVMPKFISLYSDLNIQLPLITRFMIGVVNMLNSPILFLALALLAVGLHLKRAFLREWAFRIALKLPYISGVLGSMLAARFCDTVSCAYKVGVPLNQILAMMMKGAPFEFYRQDIREVLHRLETTGDLAEAIAAVPYFPQLVCDMAMIGEESGDVTGLLDATSRFMDQQNELLLAQLVSLIEPVVIALLGITMAFFFVAMFLPVYGMLSQF